VHERLRWRERLDDDAAWNALAEHDRAILGCVSFTQAHLADDVPGPIPGRAHLSRMFVEPEHWGRGIGSLLLRRAVEEMTLRGYGRAQLFTPAANMRSRRFYAGNGWRMEGETRHWHGLLLVRYGRRLDRD
jgi:GNAT superfamily N-acetyltransferase